MKNQQKILRYIEEAEKYEDMILDYTNVLHNKESEILVAGSRIEELAYLTALLLALQNFDEVQSCEEDYIGVIKTLVHAAKAAFGELFYRCECGGLCIELLNASADRSAKEFCNRVHFCKDYLNHLGDC